MISISPLTILKSNTVAFFSPGRKVFEVKRSGTCVRVCITVSKALGHFSTTMIFAGKDTLRGMCIFFLYYVCNLRLTKWHQTNRLTKQQKTKQKKAQTSNQKKQKTNKQTNKQTKHTTKQNKNEKTTGTRKARRRDPDNIIYANNGPAPASGYFTHFFRSHSLEVMTLICFLKRAYRRNGHDSQSPTPF